MFPNEHEQFCRVRARTLDRTSVSGGVRETAGRGPHARPDNCNRRAWTHATWAARPCACGRRNGALRRPDDCHTAHAVPMRGTHSAERRALAFPALLQRAEPRASVSDSYVTPGVHPAGVVRRVGSSEAHSPVTSTGSETSAAAECAAAECAGAQPTAVHTTNCTGKAEGMPRKVPPRLHYHAVCT